MPEQLFARTLRGIEWIAAAEISSLGTVSALGHREVHFEAEPATRLLGLGTVDDLFVTCARVPEIGHERSALRLLEDAARAVDIQAAVRARASCGVGAEPTDLEVVASFLGARNYNRYDIEDAVARGLAAETGWNYKERRGGIAVEASLTVRAHLRDGEAVLGVRLADKPLHRRAWKTESPKGSLHPPLARAMAMLAGDSETILDPFCGAGTIPIEATALGLVAIGSDVDPEAIAMARRNAARAGVDVSWCVADALRALDKVGALVTNLPWGRGAMLHGNPKDLARLLERAERCVVLGDEPPIDGVLRQQVSLMGAHPTLVATVVPSNLAPWRARAADAGLV